MGTWTRFYVKTQEKELLIQELKKMTGLMDFVTNEFPEDLHDNYLLDEKSKPTYLVIENEQDDWITVSHNSFSKLTDWASYLSQNLNTKLIVTAAQSVSDAYYFSLFDSGNKLREIEVCYSADFEPINFGNRFSFENVEPGSKEEYDGGVEYIFDFDEIEKYCNEFGLRIQSVFAEKTYTVLKSGEKQKTVNDFVTSLFTEKSKPWWKLW